MQSDRPTDIQREDAPRRQTDSPWLYRQLVGQTDIQTYRRTVSQTDMNWRESRKPPEGARPQREHAPRRSTPQTRLQSGQIKNKKMVWL